MNLKTLTLGLSMTSSVHAASDMLTNASTESQPWSISLSSGVMQTPVSGSSADYYRSAFADFSASKALDLRETNYLKAPSFFIRVGISDEMDYEDGESQLGNTTFGMSGLGYQLSPDAMVSIPVSAGIGTNKEDRLYKGYLGSLGLSPSLSFNSSVPGLVWGLQSNLQYYFYEYDTTMGGIYNPTASWSLGTVVSYTLGKGSVSGAVTNSNAYMSDGSVNIDRYLTQLSATYLWTPQLSTSLGWSQRDRTFGYDGTSSNVNFRYADLSLVTVSFSYSI